MITKFIFNTITIDDEAIDVAYNPKNSTIIDKNNNQILHIIEEPELVPFCSFSLEFDSYCYSDYYQPKTVSYAKIKTKRIYHLILSLNVQAIVLDNGYTKNLYQKLTYYLSILRLTEINTKHTYINTISTIEKFIDERCSNCVKIQPWYCSDIGYEYIFDFKQQKICQKRNILEICFERFGAIIETNDVCQLVDKFFYHKMSNKKTITIMPSNMSHIWKANKILTYDKIKKFKMTCADLPYYNNYKNLIIFECHSEYLYKIKYLAKILHITNIWIINSMPLGHYFDHKTDCFKISINESAKLSNLWMNFSLENKKKYKTDIIHMLLTKFNNYYTKIFYESKINLYHNLKTIKLRASPFEKIIYDGIYKNYYNWKNNLTNNPLNKYSFATKKKMKFAESQIFDTVIYLISSSTDSSKIKNFFKHVVKKIITSVTDVHQDIKILTEYDKDLIKNTDYNEENKILIEKLQQKEKQLDLVLKNYNRYSKGNIYEDLNATSCCVCYERFEDQIIKGQLICGHCICLDCAIGTFSHSTKCPVCCEIVTIHNMAIVQNNCQNQTNASTLISYLKNINNKYIILTDLPSLFFSSECKAPIINIRQDLFYFQISKIKNINHIIVITYPLDVIKKKKYQELDQILNYCSLIYPNAIINRLMIDFI